MLDFSCRVPPRRRSARRPDMRMLLLVFFALLLLVLPAQAASGCEGCGRRSQSGQHCCECGSETRCSSCFRCGGEYERMTLGHKQDSALRKKQERKDREADRLYRASQVSRCGCEKCAKDKPCTKCNKCWQCKSECRCKSKCRTDQCSACEPKSQYRQTSSPCGCKSNSKCGGKAGACSKCKASKCGGKCGGGGTGCGCKSECKSNCSCKCQGNCECRSGRCCDECGAKRGERNRPAGSTFLRDVE